MSLYGDGFTWFVGKAIHNIRLNQEKDIIDFFFEDGLSKRLGVEGDCCSHSWIEHLEIVPEPLAGARILSVEQRDMPPWDNHACDREHDYGDRNCTHDVLTVYHTVFHTDRGDIVLEYRNDSNGYYGGSLTDEGPVPA